MFEISNSLQVTSILRSLHSPKLWKLVEDFRSKMNATITIKIILTDHHINI